MRALILLPVLFFIQSPAFAKDGSPVVDPAVCARLLLDHVDADGAEPFHELSELGLKLTSRPEAHVLFRVELEKISGSKFDVFSLDSEPPNIEIIPELQLESRGKLYFSARGDRQSLIEFAKRAAQRFAPALPLSFQIIDSVVTVQEPFELGFRTPAQEFNLHPIQRGPPTLLRNAIAHMFADPTRGIVVESGTLYGELFFYPAPKLDSYLNSPEFTGRPTTLKTLVIGQDVNLLEGLFNLKAALQSEAPVAIRCQGLYVLNAAAVGIINANARIGQFRPARSSVTVARELVNVISNLSLAPVARPSAPAPNPVTIATRSSAGSTFRGTLSLGSMSAKTIIPTPVPVALQPEPAAPAPAARLFPVKLPPTPLVVTPAMKKAALQKQTSFSEEELRLLITVSERMARTELDPAKLKQVMRDPDSQIEFQVADFYNWTLKPLMTEHNTHRILAEDPATDPDLMELIALEQPVLVAKIKKARADLLQLIARKQVEAQTPVIVELAAQSGQIIHNEEIGAIEDMYIAMARIRGWKVKVLDESFDHSHELRHVSLRFDGAGVFPLLKFERGTHRFMKIDSGGKTLTHKLEVKVHFEERGRAEPEPGPKTSPYVRTYDNRRANSENDRIVAGSGLNELLQKHLEDEQLGAIKRMADKPF